MFVVAAGNGAEGVLPAEGDGCTVIGRTVSPVQPVEQ